MGTRSGSGSGIGVVNMSYYIGSQTLYNDKTSVNSSSSGSIGSSSSNSSNSSSGSSNSGSETTGQDIYPVSKLMKAS